MFWTPSPFRFLTRLAPPTILLTICLCGGHLQAQADTTPMAVRGLCLAAPNVDGLDRFIAFIENDLAAREINTLVLRVDFNYAYESHPELREDRPLTATDANRLATACRENNIRLIPQINLLGHQSWASDLGKLLEVYPEFDETPHISLPEDYAWPNEDGLYCKSYCPLHPEVHDVVFALVDEVMEAFEADAFHAGMDEVFYIGDDNCPRCAGKDKSKLFANEVSKIRNHLADSGRELWIWGDRLIDGELTGIGLWEASENDTHRAIDLIPRDVVICDWHYERAEPTATLFALKGLQVITCPWNKPQVAKAQLQAYHAFQRDANPTLRQRYLGIMQTYWSGADRFLDLYYGDVQAEPQQQGPIDSFKLLFPLKTDAQSQSL